MWPALSGRKTLGTLEAHTNGLRFVSQKSEKVGLICRTPRLSRPR